MQRRAARCSLRPCVALRIVADAPAVGGGSPLRWINADPAESVQTATMVLDRSQPHSPAQAAQAAVVRNLPALAPRHDLVTVPAAWPAGASQLAIAIDVVHRSNDVEVHRDWVAAARN